MENPLRAYEERLRSEGVTHPRTEILRGFESTTIKGSHAMLYLWSHDRRWPTTESQLAIQEATNGAVTLDDWHAYNLWKIEVGKQPPPPYKKKRKAHAAAKRKQRAKRSA